MIPSHRPSRSLNAQLWLGWLALILISGGDLTAGQPPSPGELRAFVERNQRRQAYGVYLAGRKFGWAIDELKLGQREGKDVAVYTFEMHGSFSAAGEQSSFDDTSVTCYELEGAGAIVYAEERSTEDGNEVVRTAIREGNELVITTRSAGVESRRRAPLSKDTLQLMLNLERWLTGPPKRGARFESYSLALDQPEIDTKEIFSYRSKKSMLWGGVASEVYLVTVHIEGMTMQCEVLRDGTLVKGLIGGLFELRSEKELVAKQRGSQPVDMLEASSIKVNKDLGDPELIESLHLKISGLEAFPFPVSHRQRIRSRTRRSIEVELSRDDRSAVPSPLSATERREHLKATPNLQCDHESILALAKEIVGEESDPVRMADRLQEWIYSNVRQTMAANTSTALDVLRNRAGDCTEITTLFVALARAAGLPAREVGGIMYANEGTPLFGWHAWAEIHDGRQWVSVDPTWNQVYVDATHIKLAEGSNDWAWVNLLGRMKISVVKVTRKK